MLGFVGHRFVGKQKSEIYVNICLQRNEGWGCHCTQNSKH